MTVVAIKLKFVGKLGRLETLRRFLFCFVQFIILFYFSLQFKSFVWAWAGFSSCSEQDYLELVMGLGLLVTVALSWSMGLVGIQALVVVVHRLTCSDTCDPPRPGSNPWHLHWQVDSLNC